MWWRCSKRLHSQRGDGSWCLSRRLLWGVFLSSLCLCGFSQFTLLSSHILDFAWCLQIRTDCAKAIRPPLCPSLKAGLAPPVSVWVTKQTQQEICTSGLITKWGTKFYFTSWSPETGSDTPSGCSVPCFLLLCEGSGIWEEQSALGGSCNRGDGESWRLHGGWGRGVEANCGRQRGCRERLSGVTFVLYLFI